MEDKHKLSTHCFAHLAVLRFKIVFDWKLLLIYTVRLHVCDHQTTELPFSLSQEQNLLALVSGQSDLGVFPALCQSQFKFDTKIKVFLLSGKILVVDYIYMTPSTPTYESILSMLVLYTTNKIEQSMFTKLNAHTVDYL